LATTDKGDSLSLATSSSVEEAVVTTSQTPQWTLKPVGENKMLLIETVSQYAIAYDSSDGAVIHLKAVPVGEVNSSDPQNQFRWIDLNNGSIALQWVHNSDFNLNIPGSGDYHNGQKVILWGHWKGDKNERWIVTQ